MAERLLWHLSPNIAGQLSNQVKVSKRALRPEERLFKQPPEPMPPMHLLFSFCTIRQLGDPHTEFEEIPFDPELEPKIIDEDGNQSTRKLPPAKHWRCVCCTFSRGLTPSCSVTLTVGERRVVKEGRNKKALKSECAREMLVDHFGVRAPSLYVPPLMPCRLTETG